MLTRPPGAARGLSVRDPSSTVANPGGVSGFTAPILRPAVPRRPQGRLKPQRHRRRRRADTETDGSIANAAGASIPATLRSGRPPRSAPRLICRSLTVNLSWRHSAFSVPVRGMGQSTIHLARDAGIGVLYQPPKRPTLAMTEKPGMISCVTWHRSVTPSVGCMGNDGRCNHWLQHKS